MAALERIFIKTLSPNMNYKIKHGTRGQESWQPSSRRRPPQSARRGGEARGNIAQRGTPRSVFPPHGLPGPPTRPRPSPALRANMPPPSTPHHLPARCTPLACHAESVPQAPPYAGDDENEYRQWKWHPLSGKEFPDAMKCAWWWRMSYKDLYKLFQRLSYPLHGPIDIFDLCHWPLMISWMCLVSTFFDWMYLARRWGGGNYPPSVPLPLPELFLLSRRRCDCREQRDQ